MSHGYHAICFNTNVLLLLIPINLIDSIKKSLLVLEIRLLLEMFDISSLSRMMTRSTHAEFFVAPIFPDQ